MVESSVAHPSLYYIAIVPEQSTLRMQREVVAAHPAHAVMNIDIVSFERLAHRVFQELGTDETAILNDTGKVLLLRKVLEECRDDLTVYRNKVHMPGFAEEVKSVVTELKQYAKDDNDLFLMQDAAEKAGNKLLYAKLQDIRLILRKFN
ncbi:MAG: ATP-dependent nuclease, partial [Parasporobacterium sp.]|nr:ATP-dependent nuclease [Parasporobacterium sp.]